MMKNSQTYFKNLAIRTLQDFQCMFRHFSNIYMKGVIRKYANFPVLHNCHFEIGSRLNSMILISNSFPFLIFLYFSFLSSPIFLSEV